MREFWGLIHDEEDVLYIVWENELNGAYGKMVDENHQEIKKERRILNFKNFKGLLKFSNSGDQI